MPAARFNAANDRISYLGAGAPPDTATGFSFTCWAYLSSDLNTNSTLLRLHAASGGSTRLTFATAGDGTTPALFSIGNGGGVVSPLAMVVGQWRALGFSCTGTSGTIRAAGVDGGLLSVSSATGTVSGGSTATGFTLGGRSSSDATEIFDGRIAYPRLWSSTMTQAEMIAEWASTSAVRASGLWGAYELPNLADLSGNGRNLTAGASSADAEPGPPIDARNGQFLALAH